MSSSVVFEGTEGTLEFLGGSSLDFSDGCPGGSREGGVRPTFLGGMPFVMLAGRVPDVHALALVVTGAPPPLLAVPLDGLPVLGQAPFLNFEGAIILGSSRFALPRDRFRVF